MNATIRCTCPPKKDGEPRHASDTVTFRDRLDFRSAVTMQKAIALVYNEDPQASTEDVLAALTVNYLLHGITGWTRHDGKDAIPPSRPAIRAFMDEHPAEAMQLADVADELYSEQVLLPLLARVPASSPPTPISGSTSATTDGSPKRPRPLKPSSTTTSQMDGIGTTSSSPAGDSSSSQSSTSAA